MESHAHPLKRARMEEAVLARSEVAIVKFASELAASTCCNNHFGAINNDGVRVSPGGLGWTGKCTSQMYRTVSTARKKVVKKIESVIAETWDEFEPDASSRDQPPRKRERPDPAHGSLQEFKIKFWQSRRFVAVQPRG